MLATTGIDRTRTHFGYLRGRDETDLDALTHDLSDSIRAEAEASGVTLRLEVARDLAHIRLDHAHLQDTLLNMVHEALRGLELGQVEARELIIRIALTPARQIELGVALGR